MLGIKLGIKPMNFNDLINKYINKARTSKLDIELPFNVNDYSTYEFLLIESLNKSLNTSNSTQSKKY